MIDDERIEKALDFLQRAPQRLAEAKEAAVMAAHMRTHIRALQMKVRNEESVSAQTREAEASEAYKEALLRDAEAAGAFEKIRAQVNAAELTISVWQTQQKALRGPRP